MSRPLSDAQIYMLLWAAESPHGALSELHDPPCSVRAPDGRRIELLRTACDRAGLLGLDKRGFLHEDRGVWTITGRGDAALRQPRTLARIAAMADATAADDARVREDHAREVADQTSMADAAAVDDVERSQRPRTGPPHRAGSPSSETLRFRCSEAESMEIQAACDLEERTLSDVARELLLAWARRVAKRRGASAPKAQRDKLQELKHACTEAAKRHKLPPAQKRVLKLIASAGGRIFEEGLKFSRVPGGPRLSGLHHCVLHRLVDKGLLTWERGDTADTPRRDVFALSEVVMKSKDLLPVEMREADEDDVLPKE